MNELKAQLSEIVDKYKDNYFKLKDYPSIGEEVVFLPSYGSMVYELHDGGYGRYDFSPGKILTVKRVEMQEPCNSVFVKESKCAFSPAELISRNFVDEEDIIAVKNIYQEKLKEVKSE